MGFLNFKKAAPNQSHIIYTDNVRRKSSFSIFVSAVENENNTLGDVSKHIETFEENADPVKEIGKFITDESGSVMIVTELGANFVYQENDEERGNVRDSSDPIHKWVVFGSVFILMLINNGFIYSFGTLFPVILEVYGENRASTAAIQSVFTAIGLSAGIFTGPIAQRFGPRKCGVFGSIVFSAGLLISSFATSTVYLQISYGVISAFGFSFLFICSNQILSQLFEGQTRIICISTVTAGSGLAGIFYPYILDWLSNRFGLNGVFLLLSGITMNIIPLTLLWTTHTRSTANPSSNVTKPSAIPSKKRFCKSFTNTVSYKPFLFLFLGVGFIFSTVNVFGILAMDILGSNGLSVAASLDAVIVSNAASIPGRLIPGFLQKIPGYSSVMTPLVASLLGVGGILLLNFISTFTGSVIACGIMGVARGFMVGSISVATLKVVGVKRFSVGLGITCGVVGLMTTMMGPVNGSVRDLSGSYKIPLYISSVAFLIGGVLCFIALLLHIRVKAKRKRERSMSVFTVTRF